MKRLIVLLIVLLAAPSYATTKAQVFQTLLSGLRYSGTTLNGGKAYFYAPGTTTPKEVYSDRDKTTPILTAVTLSADGTASVFGDGVYDVKITTSAGVQKAYWYGIEVSSFNYVVSATPAAGDIPLLSGTGVLALPNAVHTINGNKIFHAGNDGAGSGLDADTLDTYNPATTGTATSIPVANAQGKLDGSWLATQGVRGTYRNLAIDYASAATVSITADEVVLQNASGYSKTFASVSESANVAASGANGLDTGIEAVSTWYYIWLIGKDDGTIDSLLSISSTAPTMPTGYTYKGLFGAVRNNGSSNFIDFTQVNNKVFYRVTSLPTLKDGSFTINAWTAVDATTCFPATAKFIKLILGSVTNPLGMASFSNGTAGEINNFSDSAGTGLTFGGLLATSRSNIFTSTIIYQSSVYYYVGSANSTLSAVGWEY